MKMQSKTKSMLLIVYIFLTAFILMFTVESKSATYEFKYKENITVRVEASDKYKGMRKAAMICYRTLTNNVYPGEERGMGVIDICSNPENYEKAEVKL